MTEPLFTDIRHGWANIHLGKFEGLCSYLTDPVYDISRALLAKEDSVVHFDGEHTGTFDLILSTYDEIYAAVFDDRDHIVFTGVKVKELVPLFIASVEENMEAWTDWSGYEDEEEMQVERPKRRKQIQYLLRRLKKKYKNIL